MGRYLLGTALLFIGTTVLPLIAMMAYGHSSTFGIGLYEHSDWIGLAALICAFAAVITAVYCWFRAITLARRRSFLAGLMAATIVGLAAGIVWILSSIRSCC